MNWLHLNVDLYKKRKKTEKDVLEIISTGVASVCKIKNVLE